MKPAKAPVTQAIRVLRSAKIPFEGHLYDYVDGGGTSDSARQLDVDEHSVIKTLIMEDDTKRPMIVLMHGDRQVSTQALARAIGVKRVSPCDPNVADKHSGYQVGGTSPFGTRRSMPVYCEQGIAELPRIYINGGKRGYIIRLATADAFRILQPTLVSMAA
ncbi:Cys-tRNA(Pro) deacylase [Thiorhodococcus mannitoliphagus]|uniref:Cys-tRNA(Pro)/Cys-tRNA(Cys) deacylase n=1 Tax=Thiorhodococcus mannitoliphagus TaxID=329406 RepID=A0A6P1DWN1_9GAMM|nr:Cys-tRNA(Pro) deacylase [Thiorhodococcus mannitoliphagus]NEX20532.1 Cys-tRNA(Pro) deacylase [Thiorhodococcus mannitoliphagus]